MRTMRCLASRACQLVIGLVMATTAIATAAEEPKLNLSAWQHIPVLHDGRVMPLESFSRMTVETICDRTNPTLEFDGKPRRFTPAELLLSWITEPQRWEKVPFLIAEYDALRTDVLDVPVTAADGTHLRYVSPATVVECKKLDEMMRDINERVKAARASGEEPALSSVETKARELYSAYSVFRQITFDPRSEEARRDQFLGVGFDVVTNWRKLEDDLTALRARPELNEAIGAPTTHCKKSSRAFGVGIFPSNR